MNKITIISLLVLLLFLAGCASQEVSTASEKSGTTETKTTTTTKTTSTGTKTTSSSTTQVNDAAQLGEEEVGRVGVTDSGSGQTTTFRKLGPGERAKIASEKCIFDYPIDCSDYSASNGIVYLTLKNKGYTSKIDKVVLRLNGDECDPANTYLETGQLKEFECFVDAGTDVVSGQLEMTYHSNIEQSDFLKKGTVVVIME